MPRPWETEEAQKLKKEHIRTFEEQYGPDVAGDGTTREEFYDRMVKNGWNRYGDDKIILNMYMYINVHLNRTSKDKGRQEKLYKEVMEMPATNASECRNVLDKVLDARDMCYSNERYKERLVYANKKMDNRIRFEKMGWNQPGDERVADIFLEMPSRYADKLTMRLKKDDLLSDDCGVGIYNRLSFFNGLISNYKDLSKDTRSDYDKDDLKFIEENVDKYYDQCKIQTEINKKKKNPHLRQLFKKIVELKLDNIELLDDKFSVDELWGTGLKSEDVKLDAKAEKTLKDAIDDLDIDISKFDSKAKNSSNEKWKADQKNLAAPIKEKLINVLKEKEVDSKFVDEIFGFIDFRDILDEESYENGQFTADNIRKKLADHIINQTNYEIKIQKLLKAREDNPDTVDRRENLFIAARKLDRLIKTLKEDNKEYYETLKKGGNEEDIPVVYSDHANRKCNFDEISFAEYKEFLNVVEKVDSLKINRIEDLYTDKVFEDKFWLNLSEPVTDEMIEEMQNKMIELENAGLDWDELVESGKYKEYTKAINLPVNIDEYKMQEKVRRDIIEHQTRTIKRYDPLSFIKKSFEGKYAIEDIKACYSREKFEQTMDFLKTVEKDFEKKKEKIADVDYMKVRSWFDKVGFDMMNRYMPVKNGFKEIELKGEKIKVIDFNDELDASKIDRDRFDAEEQEKIINYSKEVQRLMKENNDRFNEVAKNSNELSKAFGVLAMFAYEKQKELTKDEKLVDNMNKVRHLLFKIKKTDDKICKIIDLQNNAPVMVEPLPNNTEFNRDMINREMAILDNCLEMLREPSTRVSHNSQQYKDVMDSVRNLKTVLKKSYENNDKAKDAYIKAVKKTLKNINLYRIHKAADGIKQDATHDKIVACERVDKLLTTRYNTLSGKDYAKETNAEELLKVDNNSINKELTGDDYVYAKATSKIENMRKELEATKKQTLEEKISGRKSVGAVGQGNKKAVDTGRKSV